MLSLYDLAIKLHLTSRVYARLPTDKIDYTRISRAIWVSVVQRANRIHASSTTRAETAKMPPSSSSRSESATWSRNEVTQTYIFVP